MGNKHSHPKKRVVQSSSVDKEKKQGVADVHGQAIHSSDPPPLITSPVDFSEVEQTKKLKSISSKYKVSPVTPVTIPVRVCDQIEEDTEMDKMSCVKDDENIPLAASDNKCEISEELDTENASMDPCVDSVELEMYLESLDMEIFQDESAVENCSEVGQYQRDPEYLETGQSPDTSDAGTCQEVKVVNKYTRGEKAERITTISPELSALKLLPDITINAPDVKDDTKPTAVTEINESQVLDDTQCPEVKNMKKCQELIENEDIVTSQLTNDTGSEKIAEQAKSTCVVKKPKKEHKTSFFPFFFRRSAERKSKDKTNKKEKADIPAKCTDIPAKSTDISAKSTDISAKSTDGSLDKPTGYTIATEPLSLEIVETTAAISPVEDKSIVECGEAGNDRTDLKTRAANPAVPLASIDRTKLSDNKHHSADKTRTSSTLPILAVQEYNNVSESSNQTKDEHRDEEAAQLSSVTNKTETKCLNTSDLVGDIRQADKTKQSVVQLLPASKLESEISTSLDNKKSKKKGARRSLFGSSGQSKNEKDNYVKCQTSDKKSKEKNANVSKVNSLTSNIDPVGQNTDRHSKVQEIKNAANPLVKSPEVSSSITSSTSQRSISLMKTVPKTDEVATYTDFTNVQSTEICLKTIVTQYSKEEINLEKGSESAEDENYSTPVEVEFVEGEYKEQEREGPRLKADEIITCLEGLTSSGSAEPAKIIKVNTANSPPHIEPVSLQVKSLPSDTAGEPSKKSLPSDTAGYPSKKSLKNKSKKNKRNSFLPLFLRKSGKEKNKLLPDSSNEKEIVRKVLEDKKEGDKKKEQEQCESTNKMQRLSSIVHDPETAMEYNCATTASVSDECREKLLDKKQETIQLDDPTKKLTAEQSTLKESIAGDVKKSKKTKNSEHVTKFSKHKDERNVKKNVKKNKTANILQESGKETKDSKTTDLTSKPSADNISVSDSVRRQPLHEDSMDVIEDNPRDEKSEDCTTIKMKKSRAMLFDKSTELNIVSQISENDSLNMTTEVERVIEPSLCDIKELERVTEQIIQPEGVNIMNEREINKQVKPLKSNDVVNEVIDDNLELKHKTSENIKVDAVVEIPPSSENIKTSKKGHFFPTFFRKSKDKNPKEKQSKKVLDTKFKKGDGENSQKKIDGLASQESTLSNVAISKEKKKPPHNTEKSLIKNPVKPPRQEIIYHVVTDKINVRELNRKISLEQNPSEILEDKYEMPLISTKQDSQPLKQEIAHEKPTKSKLSKSGASATPDTNLVNSFTTVPHNKQVDKNTVNEISGRYTKGRNFEDPTIMKAATFTTDVPAKSITVERANSVPTKSTKYNTRGSAKLVKEGRMYLNSPTAETKEEATRAIFVERNSETDKSPCRFPVKIYPCYTSSEGGGGGGGGKKIGQSAWSSTDLDLSDIKIYRRNKDGLISTGDSMTLPPRLRRGKSPGVSNTSTPRRDYPELGRKAMRWDSFTDSRSSTRGGGGGVSSQRASLTSSVVSVSQKGKNGSFIMGLINPSSHFKYI